jgi:uncharacterized protein involved in exopolysaccharide biosynthesis
MIELELILVSLKKYLGYILGVSFLLTFLSFLFTKDLPNEYSSGTQLSTGFTINNYTDYLNENTSSSRNADIQFNNLIETIKSRIVINLLSYKLLLHDIQSDQPFRPNDSFEIKNVNLNQEEKEELINTLNNKLLNYKNLSVFSDTDKKIIDLLKAYNYDYKSLIQDGLSIKRVGFSDYIDITFLSENPNLSAYVVNTLANQIINYNQFLLQERTIKSLQFFTNLVATKKKELDEKNEDLKFFKTSNNLMNFETESEVSVNLLTRYENLRNEELRNIRKNELLLANIDTQLTQQNTTSNNNSNNKLNSRLIVIRNNINRLNEEYIRSGYNKNSLLDSLNILREEELYLKQQIDQRNSYNNTDIASNNLIQEKNRIQNDLAVSRSYLASLENKISEVKSNANKYASSEASINSLQREVELANQEYLVALEKYNNIKNASMVDGNSLVQVIMGQPNYEPEPSKKIFTETFLTNANINSSHRNGFVNS